MIEVRVAEITTLDVDAIVNAYFSESMRDLYDRELRR